MTQTDFKPLIGKALVILGFLGGAFLASLDPIQVNWPPFVAFVALGSVGAWMVKSGEKAAVRSSDKLHGNRQVLEDSLDRIVSNLRELDGRKERVPTYDMRFQIDELFRDDLFAFADARDSMKYLFGLQAYADVMSSFAAGERYINRVWSASTDGYVDEVLLYVSRALDQFIHAKEVFDQVKDRPAP